MLGITRSGGFPGAKLSTTSRPDQQQQHVASAWQDVRSSIIDILAGDGALLPDHITPAHVRNVTFSLGMFSLHDADAARSMQIHHTSPEIANAPNGTHFVDGDSVYRIASVTKLFTVLTGLIELTTADWDRPLSDVLAPLAAYNAGSDNQDPYTTPWAQVTLRALAAQISGVAHDGFPNAGEIALQALQGGVSEADLIAASGLPPVNASDPLSNPPCLLPTVMGESCSATDYIEGVANRAPTFLPWTTPGYSNNGFTLLGLAIANITGRSMTELFGSDIFSPLRMTSSFAAAPPVSEWHRSVIVGAPAAGFAADNGIFVSSGGLYSTTNDLASFGVSILNSTLLPADQTRRWLKPVSHTARLQYSVGAPWEIVRYTLASGTVTDIYTKLGDAGYYSSYLVLLPDFGAGFSILTASSLSQRVDVQGSIAQVVADKMVPALATQAAAEAAHNFAGLYTASNLNSTLTLSVDTSGINAPGLVISSWMSNGTDVLTWLGRHSGSGPYRLVPSTTPTKAPTNGYKRQIAFRMVNSVDAPSSGNSLRTELFTSSGIADADWENVDTLTYYGVGLSLFVMDIGCDGRAVSVTPAAYRTKLMRSA